MSRRSGGRRAKPKPKTEGSKLAVLYARVSSRTQENEGFSIPAQLKLLRDYAAGKGIVIVEEFVEAESAKKAGRKRFKAMLQFLEQRPAIRNLLVEKTDRLYRNIPDFAKLDEVDGLRIHLVKESRVIDDKNSASNFQHGLQVLLARQFVDNLREESAKGLDAKAALGMWPRRAPTGYRTERGPRGKNRIVPDSTTGPLVRSLFEKYATGSISLTQLADWAFAAGLRSFRGRRVQRSRIHQILTNRIYAGQFLWKERLVEGIHDPLVSLELWEKAQGRLLDRSSGQHAKGRREFSYSGLIRCGHCDCMLVAEIKKERYIYYHCSRARRRCPGPYTREEKLDEKFAQLLASLRFDEEVLAWVVGGLRDSHAGAVRFREEAVGRLQENVSRLERRLDRLYADMIDGLIDAAQHRRLSERAREELIRVQVEIEGHRAADHAHVDDGVRLLELAQRAEQLFLTQELQEKRKLLNLVVSNSVWRHDELTVELRKPFDVLRKTVLALKSPVQGAAPGSLNFPGRTFELAHKDSNLD
ncbi:MAG: recombinase family protein [Planctomycetes bacterium]|nr:recombinase family protein [Planctomycetota bacterium]